MRFHIHRTCAAYRHRPTRNFLSEIVDLGSVLLRVHSISSNQLRDCEQWVMIAVKACTKSSLERLP